MSALENIKWGFWCKKVIFSKECNFDKFSSQNNLAINLEKLTISENQRFRRLKSLSQKISDQYQKFGDFRIFKNYNFNPLI